MKNVIEKVIYFVFTIFIYILLRKVVTLAWDNFVPLNFKTNLLGAFVVFPIMVGASFILASITFKFIKKA
ncbi:hypothetical protein HMI01_28150 [Halolactibacillus miurensis]|uniref:Inhibitor of the pro-sigma K processing machinery n=1 Tax=Halolactibacillus miurensis TaxID=306541 RepID=A0A1I6V1D0_9BACI|nr:hypothetical protein HMI01_28150 [Halolactibacillus miurensis]SFT07483.1 hypothetical protein SAMN05421668_1405 [Halolactibacillus miurensis]